MKKEVILNHSKKNKKFGIKCADVLAKIASVSAIIATNTQFAFAIIPDANILTSIDSIVSNILTYVAIGGALLMLFGVFSVIMAIREEDAGRKSSGILNIVVGALLVSLKLVVWNVIKGLIGIS